MLPTAGRDGRTLPRVLVVGRDDGHRRTIARELEAMGYEYECFVSGTSAAEALLERAFRLMFVDARLESPDIRTLKSVGEILNDGFRCVAWVDSSEVGAAERALAASPFACLTVPVGARDLRSLLGLVAQDSADGRRKA